MKLTERQQFWRRVFGIKMFTFKGEAYDQIGYLHALEIDVQISKNKIEEAERNIDHITARAQGINQTLTGVREREIQHTVNVEQLLARFDSLFTAVGAHSNQIARLNEAISQDSPIPTNVIQIASTDGTTYQLLGRPTPVDPGRQQSAMVLNSAEPLDDPDNRKIDATL